MTRIDIINMLVSERGYRSYLEIGVWRGSSFRSVDCPVKVGVDPAEGSAATHKVTSDAFFAANRDTFDVVFIDGLHQCDQVLRDIHNALGVLNPGGVVVVHDCLPANAYMATADRHTGLWCGDVYKAVAWYFSQCPYRCYTVDTDYGVGVIDTSVAEPARRCFPGADMHSLSYDAFTARRSELLHVVAPRDLAHLVSRASADASVASNGAEFAVQWGRYFDSVTLLHYAPYENRMPRMVSELERVGLWGSDVFHIVTARPVRGLSAERNLSFYTARALDDFLYGGGRRICILENDVAFLKDLRLLDAILADAPDGGVLQLDKFPPSQLGGGRYDAVVRENRVGAYFFRNPGMFIPGGACYALDRSAAETMLARLVTGSTFPDGYLARLGCPVYVAATNAAIQVMYKDGVAASRWCTRNGVRINSHTEAYLRMGLRYSDYAVPTGYTETSLYYDPEEGK